MGRLVKMIMKEVRKSTHTVADSIPVADNVDGDVSSSVLSRYQRCKDNKVPFEVVLNYANPKGDVSGQDENGVHIVMTYETIKKMNVRYNNRDKDRLIGNLMSVDVVSIDAEANTVYVSPNDKVSTHADNEKAQVLKEINVELKEKGKIRVNGRIVSVKENRAIVDILNMGISGICYAREWKGTYTRDMRDFCKVGDIYDFEIIGKEKRYNRQEYILSRRQITPDPWKQIPEDLLEVGAVILVECVEKPKITDPKNPNYGKEVSYWWGRSISVPDIEIQGNYLEDKHLTVLVGVTYKCRIKKLNLEKHEFQVTPFEPVNAKNAQGKIIFDEETIGKAMEFVSSKKPEARKRNKKQ